MILCAAVKFHIDATDEDVVLCGWRHGNIYNQLKCLGFKPQQGYKRISDGFIDDKGNFLTREEAFLHAKECGQIQTEKENGIIYTEDLY